MTRGYVTAEAAALTCALTLVVAIALSAGLGTALSQRDSARATEASATRRADVCAVDLARLTARAADLDERVRLHLAIDDDRACACWEAP